jgi:alpha-amylase
MRFTFKHLTAAVISLLALAGCSANQASEQFEDQVGVQLFMWNFNSIAQECEYLGTVGIDWVLVAPPQEHIQGGEWWVGYQPVSYQIGSQLGTQSEFEAMVKTCGERGVEIYVDAVINHMTGSSEGVGTAGTEYAKYEYSDLYTRSDFHACEETMDGQIADWANLTQVQECELLNLADLRTEDETVRAKIVDYLQSLVNLGVTGFRIDAAKHIPVADLEAIKAKLPADIKYIQEVIPGTPGAEPGDYLGIGDIFGFDLAYQLASIFSQQVAFLPDTSTESPWITPSNQTVVMVSNHDTERNGQTLNYSQPAQFEAATALMLALDYGQPMLYSSYAFDNYDWAPKDENGRVLDAKCAQSSPIYLTNHDPGTWLCQHRMNWVNGMIEFRAAASGKPLTNPQTSDAVLSFERGDTGFFAVNVTTNDQGGIEITTNLADGKYVDMISGREYDIAAGVVKVDLTANQALALIKR